MPPLETQVDEVVLEVQVVVQVAEHARVLEHAPEHVLEAAEDVRADRVAFECHEAPARLVDAVHVEVVEPEVHQHLLELALALDGAQQLGASRVAERHEGTVVGVARVLVEGRPRLLERHRLHRVERRDLGLERAVVEELGMQLLLDECRQLRRAAELGDALQGPGIGAVGDSVEHVLEDGAARLRTPGLAVRPEHHGQGQSQQHPSRRPHPTLPRFPRSAALDRSLERRRPSSATGGRRDRAPRGMHVCIETTPSE